MVHNKAGLPKPLPFLKALGIEMCGGQEILSVVEVGQDCPAAEELSSSHAPAGTGVPRILLLGGHVDHEVHHPVAVAEFIVVPGNALDKVVIEGNASPSIEGRRVNITVEVTGDNLVLSVA